MPPKQYEEAIRTISTKTSDYERVSSGAFFVFQKTVKWACIKTGAGAVSGAVWCGFLTHAEADAVPHPVIMEIKKTA